MNIILELYTHRIPTVEMSQDSLFLQSSKDHYSFNMRMFVAIRSISLMHYVNILCSEKHSCSVFSKKSKKTVFYR